MIPVTELWLPIVVSAVFVFVVSALIHMVLAIHKCDYGKLPNEEKAREALRGVPPGDYAMPRPTSMKEMASPEFVARYKEGPVAVLTVMPSGVPNMNRSLMQWFVYCVVVSVFAGYVAGATLGRDASYLRVFQVAGAVAVGIYVLSNVMNSIWKGVAWSTTFKYVLDGLVYGLVTAGTFGWLWP
jgi:hypothetical protein